MVIIPVMTIKANKMQQPVRNTAIIHQLYILLYFQITFFSHFHSFKLKAFNNRFENM